MIEIERKFLLKTQDFRSQITRSFPIIQGYISFSPERNVRIRTYGHKAFLTIKGASSASGMSRFEWEKEIDLSDAQLLFEQCKPGRIEKMRHLVPAGPHTYEIDEFSGENQGLILAEIELSHEEEDFIRPDWLGQEVTGDPRYYNSQLLRCPYTAWGLEKAGFNGAAASPE